MGGGEVLSFQNGGGGGGGDSDSSPFMDKLNEVFEIQQTSQEYIPVVLDE